MKKIYILLMHTKTIPSKIVRFFTRYKYSHVVISLDKSCEVTYSFGRRRLNSILNGGFNILNKEGEFFKKFNRTECKIYEVDVTEEQYKKVVDIIEDMIKEQDKYKYDFIGIIPRFFGIPITLESNVQQLHKEAFGETDYTPSDTVKTISESIIKKTGYTK